MAKVSSQAEDLRDFVLGVVRAQGNIFIRELLRSRGVPIGANKQEFEANLREAIDDGKLTWADVQKWLDDVEGWGDQHIYLFHVPDLVVADEMWIAEEGVRRRLPAALKKLWNADTSLSFPDERTLTGIYFGNDELRYVWHQGARTWVREPGRDLKNKIIRGDRFEFRAYRERPDRSVMRFVVRPKLRLAAAFMQIPWTRAAHEEALEEVRAKTGALVDWGTLSPFSASDTIKNLDQIELAETAAPPSKISAQRTRLSDAGNYVEFASSTEKPYKQSQAVRLVRRAVKTEDFRGTVGAFLYQAVTPTGLGRTVRMEIFGEDPRIRLWAQLKANEVWDILQLLRDAERWPTRTQTGIV